MQEGGPEGERIAHRVAGGERSETNMGMSASYARRACRTCASMCAHVQKRTCVSTRLLHHLKSGTGVTEGKIKTNVRHA